MVWSDGPAVEHVSPSLSKPLPGRGTGSGRGLWPGGTLLGAGDGRAYCREEATCTSTCHLNIYGIDSVFFFFNYLNGEVAVLLKWRSVVGMHASSQFAD